MLLYIYLPRLASSSSLTITSITSSILSLPLLTMDGLFAKRRTRGESDVAAVAREGSPPKSQRAVAAPSSAAKDLDEAEDAAMAEGEGGSSWGGAQRAEPAGSLRMNETISVLRCVRECAHSRRLLMSFALCTAMIPTASKTATQMLKTKAE